jgi:hypothetical protein
MNYKESRSLVVDYLNARLRDNSNADTCQRSSNPAVFLSSGQVIQHPDVRVIPHT